MRKRIVLVMIVLAMVLCSFAGCKSADNQEESALAGAVIGGNLQDNADLLPQEQPKDENIQEPSTDGGEIKDEPTDGNADTNENKDPVVGDTEPAPENGEPTPTPNNGGNQTEQPQNQPSGSGNEKPTEKPNTNETPDATVPDGDQDVNQEPAIKDPEPTPDDSEPTPTPDTDSNQNQEPQEQQPPASEQEDPTEKPNVNAGPVVVDPDAEDSGWYKVASYNIKSMHYDPKTRQTGVDMREDIARILREIDADIVGLQEVDNNNKRSGYLDQTKWLAEQLGYGYYYFTRTVQKGDGDYGHAILSRFPIKKVDEVEFKEQHGEFRKYTRAVLDVDGQEVAFFNVHSCIQIKLESGGRDSTPGQQQFREVVSVLQKEKIPGVMTGDFNLPKETQFKLFDRAKVTSMNGGKTLKNLSSEISIDNIYVNQKMDYYVDGAGMSVFVGKETASDHDPLWSYFKIKE